MSEVTQSAKAPRRMAADVLQEIEAKLATLDGVATSDAFRLGGLVREYGQITAGEASDGIMLPLLDGLLKPRKSDSTDASKPPWL